MKVLTRMVLTLKQVQRLNQKARRTAKREEQRKIEERRCAIRLKIAVLQAKLRDLKLVINYPHDGGKVVSYCPPDMRNSESKQR